MKGNATPSTAGLALFDKVLYSIAQICKDFPFQSIAAEEKDEMKSDIATASRIVHPLSQPCGAEGAVVLALREFLFASSEQAEKKHTSLLALIKKIKGPRGLEVMLSKLGGGNLREWARLFARFNNDESDILTHMSRCADRAEKSQFIGNEAYRRLVEVSPFQGSRLVVIQSRQPANRDDEREFFKALIKEKEGECDTNMVYVLVLKGLSVADPKIFTFHPVKDLLLDIP